MSKTIKKYIAIELIYNGLLWILDCAFVWYLKTMNIETIYQLTPDIIRSNGKSSLIILWVYTILDIALVVSYFISIKKLKDAIPKGYIKNLIWNKIKSICNRMIQTQKSRKSLSAMPHVVIDPDNQDPPADCLPADSSSSPSSPISINCFSK